MNNLPLLTPYVTCRASTHRPIVRAVPRAAPRTEQQRERKRAQRAEYLARRGRGIGRSEYERIRSSGPCAYCGGAATQCDHVRPLTKGGTDEVGNLVPCCSWCNQSKGARLLTEWRRFNPSRRHPSIDIELKRLGDTP